MSISSACEPSNDSKYFNQRNVYIKTFDVKSGAMMDFPGLVATSSPSTYLPVHCSHACNTLRMRLRKAFIDTETTESLEGTHF